MPDLIKVVKKNTAGKITYYIGRKTKKGAWALDTNLNFKTFSEAEDPARVMADLHPDSFTYLPNLTKGRSVKFVLKGDIDFDLFKIGLRPGSIKTGTVDNPYTGAINFQHFHVIQNDCVVWPQNYDIVES